MSQELPQGADRDRMCRICLYAIPTSQPATNLFDTEQSFFGLRNLAEAIVLLCEVQLLPEEHTMPRSCCASCFGSLREAFKLRAVCQESDRHLRGQSTAIKLEEQCEEEPEENAMFCMEVEMMSEDCDIPKKEPEDVAPMCDENQPPPKKRLSNTLKRKRKCRKYSEQDLKNAVEQVRSKALTMNRASKKYKVPRATILFRLENADNPHVNRMGAKPAFTKEEEASVVRWLQNMQRKGFAITRANVQQKMVDLLEANPRKNNFRENRPGKTWLDDFTSRHPELHLAGRFSGSVTESYVRNWFNTIDEYISQENSLDVISDPSRVLLAYPVNLACNMSNTSVMSCVSADGLTYGPSVVLNQVSLPKALREIFVQWCAIEANEQGLLTGPLFVQWISRFVHGPLVERNVSLPVILFVECGAKCTAAFDAAEQCLEMGVVLVAVFPGATRFWSNRLQENWTKCADEHCKRSESITIEKFAQVLEAAMDRSNDGAIIQKDFRSAGLFPFDASAFEYSVCRKKRVRAKVRGGGETSSQPQLSQFSLWDSHVLMRLDPES